MNHETITDAGCQLLLAFSEFFKAMDKKQRLFNVSIAQNDQQELVFKILPPEESYGTMIANNNRNNVISKKDKTRKFFKNIEFYVGDQRNLDIHSINIIANHHIISTNSEVKTKKTAKATAVDTSNKDNDNIIDPWAVYFSNVRIFVGQFDSCPMKSS